MTDQHDKMLERIRGLLAKAASTEFEEEADAFRAKADELMNRYAIEAWQIEHAQANVNARPTPEVKTMSISWWYELDRQMGEGLWSVFLSVAAHCRCQVAWKYADGYTRSIPVVGMPADLAYADMLFTHLFMQMLERMDPKPKPGEDLVEALGRMKEAGMKWEDIFYRLRDAGYYPADMSWNASKMNYAGKYTQYCRAHNRERVYTSPTVYRRSFVSGFAMALAARLREQREEQGRDTGTMAIALRDMNLVIRDFMHGQFPKMAQRSRGVAHRDDRLDSGVVERGRRAGNEVRLLSNKTQLRKKQGELS